MHKRQRFFTIFVIFFVLSLLILVLFRTPAGNTIGGIFEIIASPLQKITHLTVLGTTRNEGEEIKNIREENRKLAAELVKYEEIRKETQALRDQFNSGTVPTKQLLPAAIIGSRASAGGNAEPTEIILDKGEKQGVRLGDAVIYKEIVVGQVIKVSENRSSVRLPISSESSIPAKTAKSNALGVIKGQNKGVLFDNVLLSDSLEKNDFVVTKGDIDQDGKGYPPGLIIGKIATVHKKASDLFQSAEVDPVLSVNRLTTVFIYRAN